MLAGCLAAEGRGSDEVIGK